MKLTIVRNQGKKDGIDSCRKPSRENEAMWSNERLTLLG
jgi:hypothetical protein